MTIHEILHKAFEQIKSEHQLAVQSVDFKSNCLISMNGNEDFVCYRIEFDAVAARSND